MMAFSLYTNKKRAAFLLFSALTDFGACLLIEYGNAIIFIVSTDFGVCLLVDEWRLGQTHPRLTVCILLAVIDEVKSQNGLR